MNAVFSKPIPPPKVQKTNSRIFDPLRKTENGFFGHLCGKNEVETESGNLSSEFFVINRESIMPVSLPLTPHRVSLNLIFRLFPGNFHERDLKLRWEKPATISRNNLCTSIPKVKLVTRIVLPHEAR